MLAAVLMGAGGYLAGVSRAAREVPGDNTVDVGGLHMVDEEIARESRPKVIALAAQMRAVQQREINQLNALLAAG